MNAPVARLEIRVQPGASKDGFSGRRADGVVRIRVRAPAVEGRANEAVEALLASKLALRRSQVKVTRGAASREKWVELAGLTQAELERMLEDALKAEESGRGS